ncbi:MAG: CAP domain-containing protein [Bacteroidia bacterium]
MKIASLFLSLTLLGISHTTLIAKSGRPMPSSNATSGDEIMRYEHMNRSMEAMRKLYNEVYLPAHNFPQGWTEPGSCKPGTLSAATLDARKREINYFRKMAGLQPIDLDPQMNHYAQAAAYLMYKNNALSHTPPTNWKCYSADGAKGAGSCNLGYGGGINSYMHDQGDNNRSVGHRMWILKESTTTMGYGGTASTDAIYVFGDHKVHDSLPQYVAWPPAGFCPEEIISDRWSISVPGVSANYENAKVTLTLGGQTIPLNYTERTGYGDDGLAFEIKDWATWEEK